MTDADASIREPYPIEQRGTPTLDQQRFITVPLEWLDANPEYGWCRLFDATSQVDEDLRGDNSVHVPRAAWDRFQAQQRYRRDLG